MPELPTEVNANITRIDAPFPEQWREELFQFSKGLEEIKAIMITMAASLVESKEAEELMLKVYSAEALQARASMVQAPQISQHREENERGEKPGASIPPNWVASAYSLRNVGPQEGMETETGSTPPDAPPSKRQNKQGSNTPYQESLEFLNKNSSLMPQHFGGRYTATDLLSLMARVGAALNQKLNGQFDEEGNLIPESVEGTGLGKITQRLSEGASSWVPNAQAAWGLGKSYYTGFKNASEGFGAYSGSLGYEPGNGALGVNNISGPFGTNFRLPIFNSAALSGITSTAEAYLTAMSYPGLSGSQVMAMNQGLAERGWFPGQKPQQELFDAQAHLIEKGGVIQQLGENPATAEMLDEGTRNGNASMEELVQTIEEIPEAAKNAHEGIAQFQASMREVGEYNESIGGTKIEGQKQAKLLSESTGLPIQAIKGIIESPYTTSAIFRETGIPSWEQGSVPAAIKNEIGTKEFWRLAEQVGPGEAHTYKTADGVTVHRSAKQSQAARIHLINPSISYETALKMLREGRTGSEGRASIMGDLEGWEQHFKEISGQGKTGLENELLRGTKVNAKGEKFNFGGVLNKMAELRTAQGKHMFSHHDLWDIRTNEGQGYSGHGQKLMEEKAAEARKILHEKARKDSESAGSPGKLVIELSPWARRLLQLPNKKTRIKSEAGAGENSTVNGYSGYSDNLLPSEMNVQQAHENGFSTSLNPGTGKEEAVPW